jgi:sialic acid synthase SpsE
MKQLNTQERKLKIIEQLIILKDDEVIKQVEELINSSIKSPPLKTLTIKELENRAKISEKNIEKGEVYSQEDVEEMSQNW